MEIDFSYYINKIIVYHNKYLRKEEIKITKISTRNCLATDENFSKFHKRINCDGRSKVQSIINMKVESKSHFQESFSRVISSAILIIII